MRFDIIAGARPNFLKIAPLIREIDSRLKCGLSYRLVHTGQHYDDSMSGSFFRDLGIPAPDINLGVGSGSQAEQTAEIMIRYERLLDESESDACVVVGDVNSTLSCSIVAKKAGLCVLHVESGLRSGDWLMPEEVNRVITDSITNHFFTTTESAGRNLLEAGVQPDRIHFVGNTMIDSLQRFRHEFSAPTQWQDYGLKPQAYFLMTLHRPANVDNRKKLEEKIASVAESACAQKVVFPAHPRTRKILDGIDLPENILVCPPLGYLEFGYLLEHALGVLTDSGGITEEATCLSVPCITLRDTTERPETVDLGTNELVGDDLHKLTQAMERIRKAGWKTGVVPAKWDGEAAKRIVDVLSKLSSGELKK